MPMKIGNVMMWNSRVELSRDEEEEEEEDREDRLNLRRHHAEGLKEWIGF